MGRKNVKYTVKLNLSSCSSKKTLDKQGLTLLHVKCELLQLFYFENCR